MLIWIVYNRQISLVSNNHTHVAYASVIDDNPNDGATVYTAMVRCQQMTKALGQQYSVQAIDLQLYSLAQQVKGPILKCLHMG